MYKMNFAASCKSSNIIHLIICRRCGQQYVGETGQPLHRKVNNHRFNMAYRGTEESPVAEHFNSNEHTLADMTVMHGDKSSTQPRPMPPQQTEMQVDHNPKGLIHVYLSGKNFRVDS